MSNPQIERTKGALRRALFSLLLDKHFDEITVEELLKQARVSRSTFYVHFRDKEDLLRFEWDRLLDFFINMLEKRDGDAFIPIEELFQHVADSHKLYRALLRSNRLGPLKHRGIERFQCAIEQKLGASAAFGVPTRIRSIAMASLLFDLLIWWLAENMPYPPSEMKVFFNRLVPTRPEK